MLHEALPDLGLSTSDERTTPVSTPAEKRAGSVKGFWRMLVGFVIVWVICVIVWALTGQGYFWPLWPALGLILGAIYAGFRIFRMPKS